MSWAREIEKLRRELIGRIETASMRMVGWTLTSTSSALGEQDSVQTGDQPDADGKQGQRPVRRVEPWGLRGRPVAKVRSFWIRFGSSNVVFLGIAPSKTYGPDSLAEGETGMYCSAGGTLVLLDKDGNIKLTSAAGKLVTINGDDYSLIKTEDFFAALKTFFDAAKGPAPIVTSPGGVPTGAFLTAATALYTALTAGTYKSTKAKNG